MLTFCNSYRVRIWTAISFVDNDVCTTSEEGDFRDRGWWGINPGACVTVHNGDVSDVNQFWYIFAIADDGTVWAGDFPTFIKDPESFDHCDGIGSLEFEVRGFRELDVADRDDFTVTFVA